MSTRPRTPAPGDVLAGKYRVERVIGEGGMGVVVAATHLQLDQLVALKFTTIEGGAVAERFLREARSAVRLKSEHVAKVSDVGTLESGTPYMVMEYLEGRDLNDVLHSTGPLPVADAVGYVVQACEAVAEAHSLGIVHRDLKPHNLFLTTGVTGLPKVKVLDFGISKTMGRDMALTRTAEIVGTPSYMSPEQLRSARDVDPRADIWALGVILYELLTARLPFEGENLPQLCTMVATETPVSPSAHRPDLPPALAEAVLRCLLRAPEARFESASELVAALAPFAPEWAGAHRVQLVPRSSASGRAVIAPASGPASPTSAAWSETELASPSRSRWRGAALFALGGLAIGAAMLLGRQMGASDPRPAAEPASAPVVVAPTTAAATSSLGAAPAAPPVAPAVASAPPAVPSVPSAPPVPTNPPPKARVATPNTPRAKTPAATTKPSAPTETDDSAEYKNR